MAPKTTDHPAPRLRRALDRIRRQFEAPDTLGFVTDLYGSILGRASDERGLARHLDTLGRFPTFADARDMLASFINSEEAQQRREAWRDRPDPASDTRPPVRALLSLGTHCLTSMMLKTYGLKRFSGPFDWIFSSPRMIAHCIEDDFRTFLDPDQYEWVPPEKRHPPNANICEHRFYRDRFGVRRMFNHHDVTQPETHAYLRRCVDRFRQSIRADHRTLLIMLAPAHEAEQEDFLRLCAALEPFEAAELMVVRMASEHGRFGATLLMEQGRHRLHDLHLTGGSGQLAFPEPRDAAMFRYMLDHYRFDLPPSVR